jgi:hypothetical protein
MNSYFSQIGMLLKFEDIEWVIRTINGRRTENTMAKLKGRKDK